MNRIFQTRKQVRDDYVDLTLQGRVERDAITARRFLAHFRGEMTRNSVVVHLLSESVHVVVLCGIDDESQRIRRRGLEMAPPEEPAHAHAENSYDYQY